MTERKHLSIKATLRMIEARAPTMRGCDYCAAPIMDVHHLQRFCSRRCQYDFLANDCRQCRLPCSRNSDYCERCGNASQVHATRRDAYRAQIRTAEHLWALGLTGDDIGDILRIGSGNARVCRWRNAGFDFPRRQHWPGVS